MLIGISHRKLGLACSQKFDLFGTLISERTPLPIRVLGNSVIIQRIDRRVGVVGTSRLLRSRTFGAVAFIVADHLAPVRQKQRHLADRAYRRRQQASRVSSADTAEAKHCRPEAEGHRPI